MRLIEILKQYSEGRTPYHMPGHKRNSSFDYIRDLAPLDFTEIDGLDNLHAPDGILKDAQNHAAEVYGASRSFFLINGTTGGILASVHALAGNGSPVIMARNCHKSVYNAVQLCHARPHYILPETHPLGFTSHITPDQVRCALTASPDAACVIITSPTYDGIVSDIAGISRICHEFSVPLIVDAAHGSHLGFLDPSVPSPVTCGADVTVMSLHKTMPSLTQTSILHLTGTLVNPGSIAASLGIFETSSPSYLFLASIDGCIHAAENPGLFENWRKQLALLHSSGYFTVPDQVFAYDDSKLILRHGAMTGSELARHLRTMAIEPEMTAADYVLLMTGAGDTDEMTERLLEACRNLPPETAASGKPHSTMPVPEIALLPGETERLPAEEIPIGQTAGRICAETVMAYPPGIPAIVPGERIGNDFLRWLHNSGDLELLTGSGRLNGTIRCVIESVF